MPVLSSIPLDLDLVPRSRRPIQLADAAAAAIRALPLPPPATIDPAVPLVSIVIVTWNNYAFTKLCLASLLQNTTYPNYEIIVVDNGSEDETVEFLDALARREPRVRVILNGRNLGFAAANNASDTARPTLAAGMPEPASAVSKVIGIVSPALGERGPVTTISARAPRCRAAMAL